MIGLERLLLETFALQLYAAMCTEPAKWHYLTESERSGWRKLALVLLAEKLPP